MPDHYRHGKQDRGVINPRNVGAAQRLLRRGPAAVDAALAGGLGKGPSARQGYRSLGPANDPHKTRD